MRTSPAGTVDILNFVDIFAATYDEINRKMLLVTVNKNIYAADLELGTIAYVGFAERDERLHSGMGDEENWTEDTNDASSSKFVEAGYNYGGMKPSDVATCRR